MRILHITILFASIHPLFQAVGQSHIAPTYRLSEEATLHSFPPSNSAAHVVSRNDTLWFGTGGGLTRTVEPGIHWEYFRGDEAFQPHGIFSVHQRGSVFWVSTGYYKETTAGSQQSGSGYTFSKDGGITWQYIPQPLDNYDVDTLQYGDNKIPTLGITTDVSNITYSLSSYGDEILTASFAGGLRKTSDDGETWTKIILPPDHLNAISPDDDLRFALSPVAGRLIDEGYLNHAVFSVFVDNENRIWTGTANGINLSLDGGSSWRKFNYQNQIKGILGNWVIKIAEQKLADGTTRIWCTNWRAEDQNEKFGVSYTDDGGETWINLLHDTRAYDFAFRDHIIYIATERGITRSEDDGRTWNTSGTIYDPVNLQQFVSREILSVAALPNGTVWVGGGEGIARTEDAGGNTFGSTWNIFRSYSSVAGSHSTYSYPNPFSPSFSQTRIHYDTGNGEADVTIEIFDFGMNLIRTLIRNAPRPANIELDEVWNGTDDTGNTVPNGVYFYRVQLNGNNGAWGKVMVLQ